MHLLRPPEGEWVCLDSVTHVDGIGMTDTALWDERGRVGRAAQTLLVRERVDPPDLAVAYFKDADEVYRYIGKLFQELAEDEELAPKFRKANTIVQYQYREPGVADHREADGGRGRSGRLRRDHHGARGRHDHGRRHGPSLLARQGERDRRARARPDEGQGPGREDPQAGAADEADLPALPRAARAGRPRGPASRPPDGGRLRARTDPAQGVQGLLPVRRHHPGDRGAGPARARPGSSSRRRARSGSSSSPTR